jgi:hypothetical protein
VRNRSRGGVFHFHLIARPLWILRALNCGQRKYQGDWHKTSASACIRASGVLGIKQTLVTAVRNVSRFNPLPVAVTFFLFFFPLTRLRDFYDFYQRNRVGRLKTFLSGMTRSVKRDNCGVNNVEAQSPLFARISRPSDLDNFKAENLIRHFIAKKIRGAVENKRFALSGLDTHARTRLQLCNATGRRLNDDKSLALAARREGPGEVLRIKVFATRNCALSIDEALGRLH